MPDHDPDPRPGSTLGNFRLLEILGEGGMGQVFLAEDLNLGRRVALKVMQPELARVEDARRRFLREARMAASIEHDRIVRVYHVGEHQRIPYIAMELLQGETLQDYLRRTPVPPLKATLRVIGHVLQGLAAAHARGMIHRDIKPANVWMEPAEGRFRCKLLDFGLARGDDSFRKQNPSGHDDTFRTEPGMIIGTLHYMPFEQLAGEPLDARADLFSVGVMLYQMLTGCLPFPASSIPEKAIQMSSTTPAHPSGVNAQVPAALGDLALRLLRKDREERPGDAGDVLKQLDRIARAPTEVVAVPVAPPPGRAPGSGKSRPVVPTAIPIEDLGTPPAPVPAPAPEGPWYTPPAGQPAIPRPGAASTKPNAINQLLDTVGNSSGSDRTRPVPPRRPDEPAGSNLLLICVGVLAFLVLATVAVVVLVKSSDPDASKLAKQDEDRKADEPQRKAEEKKAEEKKAEERKPPGKLPSPKKNRPTPSPLDFTQAGGPPSSESLRQTQQAWADSLGVPLDADVELGKGVRMSFILIPPGKYVMGTPRPMLDEIFKALPIGKREDLDDETPSHAVTITRPFYLAKTELTYAQFERFCLEEGYLTDGENGEGGEGFNSGTGKFETNKRAYHWRATGWSQSATHPVVNLTRNDALQFADWLGKKRGQLPGRFTRARLPSEAEWEYACRAGSREWFSFPGTDPLALVKYANVGDQRFRAVVKDWNRTVLPAVDGHVYPAPVASFLPNGFGLYDMLGNVDEMCEDGYEVDAYGKHASEDPVHPGNKVRRVIRGGNWRDSPGFHRCAFRNRIGEDSRRCDTGVRLVLAME